MNLDGEDWGFVGYSGNQVPGNGGFTADLAGRYSNLQGTFNKMADDLDHLQTKEGMSGEWVTKFVDKIGTMPKDFRNFATGFGDVAKALNTWSSDIDSYQRQASSAFVEVENAKRAQANAQQNVASSRREFDRVQSAYSNLSPDASDEDYERARDRRRQAQSMVDQYEQGLSTANRDLEAAKAAVHRIVDNYKKAGDEQAKAIAAATRESPKLHGFAEQWQYSDAWQITVKILEVASIVLGVIGLFFGGWIAVASAAVAALLFVDKLLAKANGDASWWEVVVSGFWALLDVGAGLKAVSKIANAKSVATTIANKVALKNGKGIFDSPVTAGIYKRVLRSQMWQPTKWGKRLLKSKDAAGGFRKMLVSEGGKAMQSGENVLSAIRHDGIGNYAANLARQGWDALGKGMHNVGHSLKNGGRAWNRFVSGWQDAKQAANAAHSNPNNTVMRDFWDGQFKRFGDWSKGHGWSIGNTVMNARTGYTDFRGIHDMKNIAAVDTRRTVWDTMNIGQHFLAYANATYDTLNTAKVVKPFVNPTADGGLQWKHSPQDYFKTLVPDPDQLWNFKTIHQAPGKLSDGAAEASNAIRVGISDL